MDLLSTIRKSGSRGGVNFSWDEVSTSQHRENYLGHSLMAPVGRWQKGRDLNWYAKADDEKGENGETPEEKKVRERKEEIKRIKEAEEDALARALGLPVAERNTTGANAISVGEVNRMVKEAGVGDEEGNDVGKGGKGFGDFVGNVKGDEGVEGVLLEPERGGLVKKSVEKEDRRERSRSRERRHRRHRHRHRSRSGERRRHRSRSGERHRHRPRHERERSRSVERHERRYRSRSPDRHRRRPEGDDRRRHSDYKPRRSRSPDVRDHDRRDRDRDFDRRR